MLNKYAITWKRAIEDGPLQGFKVRKSARTSAVLSIVIQDWSIDHEPHMMYLLKARMDPTSFHHAYASNSLSVRIIDHQMLCNRCDASLVRQHAGELDCGGTEGAADQGADW